MRQINLHGEELHTGLDALVWITSDQHIVFSFPCLKTKTKWVC